MTLVQAIHLSFKRFEEFNRLSENLVVVCSLKETDN